MLSRNIRRALLDTRWQIPPTFLLPWAANLSTAAETATSVSHDVPPLQSNNTSARQKFDSTVRRAARDTTPGKESGSSDASSATRPELPSPGSSTSAKEFIQQLSPSVRDLLPIMQSQGPHFITAHIHGRPYLMTQGDSVRLHFRMPGVEPGDILRLNCASLIGSREYTLKASAPGPRAQSPAANTKVVLDPTSGTLASHSRVMSQGDVEGKIVAPHYIPHIAVGKQSYLDDRLFVCRAVVTGVESEPMRYKEKTKRRNRKVKTVKSKHQYTIIKIKEVRLRKLEEIEAELEAGGSNAEVD